jgi:hypothetical protein
MPPGTVFVEFGEAPSRRGGRVLPFCPYRALARDQGRPRGGEVVAPGEGGGKPRTGPRSDTSAGRSPPALVSGCRETRRNRVDAYRRYRETADPFDLAVSGRRVIRGRLRDVSYSGNGGLADGRKILVGEIRGDGRRVARQRRSDTRNRDVGLGGRSPGYRRFGIRRGVFGRGDMPGRDSGRAGRCLRNYSR